jgi:pimeloyl-ACP methyl ester carboxylesterase
MQCRVRDVDFYYEEYGSGRPLLMLHGLPSDHRQMVSDMEPLFEARPGWRRLYPDLPGMGQTRGADWITHQDHMLEVALAFLDAVAPGERFVVAGTSYGGYLARGVVHRRRAQMDGLLLSVPVIETEPARRQLPQHRVLREDAQFLAALRPEESGVRDVLVVQSLGALENFRRVIAPGGAAADHAFLARLRENYAFSFDVDALPEPFAAPALFVAGRFDHWCGYREAWQLLDHYPRATFAVLDRAGHGLVFEQRGLFRALASEWLDRVEEYAGG